jgi:hypothetical protein
MIFDKILGHAPYRFFVNLMTKNRKLNKTREMVGGGLVTSLITISANLCTDSAMNKANLDDKTLEWLLTRALLICFWTEFFHTR